jgi:hypothetical protein
VWDSIPNLGFPEYAKGRILMMRRWFGRDSI